MDVQQVEIFIDRDGQVHLHVQGVKGGSCLDVTKGLEQALGGQIEAREMTAEANEEALEAVQEQTRERLRGA